MNGIVFLQRTIGVLMLTIIANFAEVAAQSLVINEVMYLNDSTLADQDDEFFPWVEIYNRGSASVQLQHYYFSNNPHHAAQWKLPAIELPSGGFVAFFLSGKNRRDAAPYHSNFTIENLHHQIHLFDSDGNLMDMTPEKCVPSQRSAGRLPDGFDNWELLSVASPESTNNIAWADTWPDADIPLMLSHESGYYTADFELEIAADQNFKIHYTLNSGNLPTHQSPLYEDPLQITNRQDKPNVWSKIQTTELATAFYIPENPVKKASVVRAVAYDNGCPVSEVVTGNFLVDPSGFQYPAEVVFVNTAPDNLFDSEKGIYVFGEQENYRNRGRMWERPAHLTFLSSQGQAYLEQDAGIRIHGGGTREGPQKSLRLYARKEYGKPTFNYPFFEERELDEYKRLILRMSMGDWSRTLFKDHLCHYLVRNMNVDFQAGKAAIVFLNGEYWGVHNIRERQDKHYLEQLYDVDDDNLDLIEFNIMFGGPVAGEGDMDRYQHLLDFVQNNDLSDNIHYHQILEMMEVDNFIDQYITQLYFANTDFPENNNSFWRERSTSGIWRWLFYDCDACMMRSQYNHLFDNLGEGEIHNLRPPWSMVLFRSLLRNEEFRIRFVSRFRTLLNTAFSAGTVMEAINKFEQMYGPLVSEHIERWQYPNNFHEWQENVQSMRIFAIDRPVMLNQWLDQYFGHPFILYPNPSNGDFSIRFYGQAEVGSVTLYNSTGQQLKSYHFGESVHEHLSFAEQLIPGIYLIRVEASGTYYTQRMVVVFR